MAVAIPPAPIGEPQGSFAWDQWYLSLQVALGTTGAIGWDLVDKAGSDLADLATRDHASLQNIQGGTTGERYHLTLAQHTVLNEGLAQGTYTPTLTNTTNIDSSTAYATMYYRLGDIVHVAGQVDVDATAAAATLTVMGISLPISSNLGNVYELAGVAAVTDASIPGTIIGDTGNDRATLRYLSGSTSSVTIRFSFSYRVI